MHTKTHLAQYASICEALLEAGLSLEELEFVRDPGVAAKVVGMVLDSLPPKYPLPTGVFLLQEQIETLPRSLPIVASRGESVVLIEQLTSPMMAATRSSAFVHSRSDWSFIGKKWWSSLEPAWYRLRLERSEERPFSEPPIGWEWASATAVIRLQAAYLERGEPSPIGDDWIMCIESSRGFSLTVRRVGNREGALLVERKQFTQPSPLVHRLVMRKMCTCFMRRGVITPPA